MAVIMIMAMRGRRRRGKMVWRMRKKVTSSGRVQSSSSVDNM
jgi:hypothetical protein